MSTTWADIASDPDIMRQGNEGYLKGKSNAELISLYQDIAKDEMKRDIAKAKGWRLGNTDEMTNLDSLAARWETELERILMYKQLEFFYFNKGGSKESDAYIRFKYYEKKYNEKASEFYKLSKDDWHIVRTVRLKRG